MTASIIRADGHGGSMLDYAKFFTYFSVNSLPATLDLLTADATITSRGKDPVAGTTGGNFLVLFEMFLTPVPPDKSTMLLKFDFRKSFHVSDYSCF